MFDISFSELALCFIVALVVLGPERLPKVARTFGRWSGQAKGYMRNLTSELERETQVGEIRRQLEEARQTLKESTESMERSTREVIDSARIDTTQPVTPETPPPADSPDTGAAKP